MQAIRSKDTVPEMRVRRLVHAAGLRYRIHARPLSTDRSTADLVFTRARVAVFLDGCYWHGCPKHYARPVRNTGYWDTKIATNQARDLRIDRALLDAGWTVIRAWEHEDPASVAAAVITAVQKTR